MSKKARAIDWCIDVLIYSVVLGNKLITLFDNISINDVEADINCKIAVTQHFKKILIRAFHLVYVYKLSIL